MPTFHWVCPYRHPYDCKCREGMETVAVGHKHIAERLVAKLRDYRNTVGLPPELADTLAWAERFIKV